MGLDPYIMEIYGAIDSNMEELKKIRSTLYENPEIGGQEYRSSDLLVNSLRSHGFEVTTPYHGFGTAFKASFDSGSDGPCVGIFAEYDALPAIGHGCGHNLICAMALGAAYGLKAVLPEIGGKVIVYGTPGEENLESKTIMASQGAFNESDVAIMCHPAGRSRASGTSRAIEAIQIEFFGKCSHAGDAPEKGINALDAAVLCYCLIKEEAKGVAGSNVHGIMDNGGERANIIPAYASLKFLVRANDDRSLSKLRDILRKCAETSSDEIGTTFRMSDYEPANAAMNTNRTLADVFDRYLSLAGETDIDKDKGSNGSTDMADVSVTMPAIHPYIGLGDPNLIPHSREFADATVSKWGDRALLLGSRALACTGYEVIAGAGVLERIKDEFSAWKADLTQ